MLWYKSFIQCHVSLCISIACIWFAGDPWRVPFQVPFMPFVTHATVLQRCLPQGQRCVLAVLLVSVATITVDGCSPCRCPQRNRLISSSGSSCSSICCCRCYCLLYPWECKRLSVCIWSYLDRSLGAIFNFSRCKHIPFPFVVLRWPALKTPCVFCFSR